MLYRSTLKALAIPRRALPISAVCFSLIWADYYYTGHPFVLLSSVPMCAIFVLVAPASWRWLFPPGAPLSDAQLLKRGLLYVAIGVLCVLLPGYGLPAFFDLGVSFLTDKGSLLIAIALFLAGGWGLGRDVDLERSLSAARTEAERLSLLALDRHLDPHFLFNTLGAIAEWHHEAPATAEEATLRLAGMLRKIVDAVKTPAWSLEQELSLVDDLLSLHRVRDPGRFTVERDIDKRLHQAQLPPMLVLSLAENALKHGPLKGHMGPISLRARPDERGFRIELENPGRYQGPRPGGDGLGMTERRLRLFFGDRAQFEMLQCGERTIARLLLPQLEP